uniref:WAPL domain-containing protein n=1 Tax=Strongyloides stercoralis TaxID=6248 RepID=A0A0K0DSG4_STRER
MFSPNSTRDTLTESLVFRESRMISESKITKRCKNFKDDTDESDIEFFRDSSLERSDLEVEGMMKTMTLDEEEFSTFIKDNNNAERENVFDNFLEFSLALSATDNDNTQDCDDFDLEGLKRVKEFINGPLCRMLISCQDDETLKNHLDTFGSFCVSMYQAYKN